MVELSCAGVGLTYASRSGAVTALRDVTFSIQGPQFVCIVGPSGCGKTTLLKIIAGILKPTAGQVRGAGGSDAPEARHSATVFQDHGLFPWMSVLDNVAFPLEARGVDRTERRARALEVIERVHLGEFAHHMPHELSGGMRQRVGIARALLADTELLLMDEPFGALDAQTKLVLQQHVLNVWTEHRKQVVYVTHDIDEAVRMGDRVLVMSGRPGRIILDLPIDTARPRDLRTLDPAAAETSRRIWDTLESEVRAGLALGDGVPA